MSKLTINNIPWPEKIRKMREDYEDKSWGFLFFKIWINLLDAEDTFDTERIDIMKDIRTAYFMDRKAIGKLLDKLERC